MAAPPRPTRQPACWAPRPGPCRAPGQATRCSRRYVVNHLLAGWLGGGSCQRLCQPHNSKSAFAVLPCQAAAQGDEDLCGDDGASPPSPGTPKPTWRQLYRTKKGADCWPCTIGGTCSGGGSVEAGSTSWSDGQSCGGAARARLHPALLHPTAGALCLQHTARRPAAACFLPAETEANWRSGRFAQARLRGHRDYLRCLDLQGGGARLLSASGSFAEKDCSIRCVACLCA